MMKFNISMSFKFDADYYSGPEFAIRESSNVGDLINRINAHFERNRPDGTLYPPLVIDWILPLFHDPTMTGEQTMTAYESLTENMYNEEFDPARHLTGVPSSLRKSHLFNPYLFPTHEPEFFYGRLRCRMSLGPNVSVAFSSENIWKALGFTDHQIGSRGFNNQFRVNNRGTHYEQIVAMEPPRNIAARMDPNKIYIGVYSQYIHLNPGLWFINIVRKDLGNLYKVEESMNSFFETISTGINLRLGFKYEDSIHKCSFLIPPNPRVMFEMRIPIELSRILGFGETEIITKENLVGKSLLDLNPDNQFEFKAKTLVYDTDMIVVTYDFTSSLSTMGMVDKVVAVLHPSIGGISKMAPGTGSKFSVSPFVSKIKFTFSRFSDEGNFVPLSWPVTTYLGGVLRGAIKGARQFE